MTITEYSLAFFLICGGVFLLVSTKQFINSTKLHQQEFEYNKYQDKVQMPLNQDTLNLLDILINIKWGDVISNNIDVTIPGTYITAVMEKALRDELTTKVKESLTDFIYTKLLLVYSQENLTNIISDKICKRVLAFKLEQNTTEIESENKK